MKGRGNLISMIVPAVVVGTIFVSAGEGAVGSPSASASAAGGERASSLLHVRTANLPACSQAKSLHLAWQLNIRAYLALRQCGLLSRAPGSTASPKSSTSGAPAGKMQIGSANQDVVTGSDTYPHVTQSEDQIAVHVNTYVIAYNDSSAAPSNFSGLSYSTNAGASWTRVLPSPFATGHGTNFGDPILVYNQRFGKFVAGDLATGCGGQGIGIWTSTAGTTSWSLGPCVHNGSQDDRESLAVDNNPSSPHYGNMYVSFNDFNIAGGALEVVRSTDGGVTWSAPIVVSATSTFMRDVQISVSPNGYVLLSSMNEGGGGLNPRTNYMYRSTDGGATFSGGAISGTFPAPGDGTSGYFAFVNPNWRYMGWGDQCALSNGVVVYDFTEHGAGSDGGDIYYQRSTDNGATFGAPVRIDGDSGAGEQWMPSIACGDKNIGLFWYDRRHTTDGTNYERWGVISTDSGLHWSTPQRVSDALITMPLQPDPNIQPQYDGDYMRDAYVSGTFLDAWTDGRTLISGNPQQDVEYQSLPVESPGPDYTIEQQGSAIPIVPGTTDIGNHCDDCTTHLPLPFPVTLYGIPYSSVNVSSNGNLQFDTNNGTFANGPLPSVQFGAAIMPFNKDLTTTTSGDGIFTATTGAAPNRTFYIEFRAHTFSSPTPENFEVAFNESSSTIRVIYGTVTDVGETIGVQGGPTGPYTQFTGTTAAGLQHEYLIPTDPSGAGGAHVLIAYSDLGPGSSPGAPSGTGRFAPAPFKAPSTLRSQLLAQPGVAAVDTFDVGARTPSAALLNGYQVVVPFSNSAFADPTTLGNELADYEQYGQGVVVGAQFDWDARGGWLLGGRWMTGGYTPFNTTTTTDFTGGTLGTYTASSPLMTGVTTLNATYRDAISLASGALLVASWNDGQPLIASKVSTMTPVKRSVGINAYLGDYVGGWSGDYAKVIVNAAHWLSPFVDTVPPTISKVVTPAVNSPFQTDSKFGISWGAADPGSGIASYDVQYKVAPYNGNYGSLQPLLTGTTKTSTIFAGTPGTTVCFQVRARDNAGNVSAYSGFKCTAIPLDDPALTRTGSWSTFISGYYYGGTASESGTVGDSVSLTGVQAKQLGVLVTKGPGAGTVQVLFNGTPCGTFNLSQGATQYRQLVTCTFSSVQSGTLQVVHSGSGNVEIDGVDMSRN